MQAHPGAMGTDNGLHDKPWKSLPAFTEIWPSFGERQHIVNGKLRHPMLGRQLLVGRLCLGSIGLKCQFSLGTAMGTINGLYVQKLRNYHIHSLLGFYHCSVESRTL